jgi:peptidoglycan/LPS O-acetylase OafA/YrhL
MTEGATSPALAHGGATPPATTERVYFPELDGLRFVAFMMVYLFHQGVPTPLLFRLIGRRVGLAFVYNGGCGVSLFFILSGYLIAALLLREEARYGRIELGAFWIRRILRIWPLYYLLIALGFGLLPALLGELGTPAYKLAMRTHFVPFLCFLGNWSIALAQPIPYGWVGVLWSVCVEEQFYLIVPLLIALSAPRIRVPLVVTLLIGSIGVRWACAHASDLHQLIVYNTFAQFDTLLSGVLLALVVGWNRDRPRLTRWLRFLQWPLYAVIAWGMSQPQLGRGSVWNRTWDYVWVWICGAGVVMVAVWGRGWLRAVLSYPRLVWLGKISYGLYMYHEIALLSVMGSTASSPLFVNKEELLSIAALALTVAMAAVSYYAYERPFLRLKRAWTRVPSRPD